jgi:hypothetical protein
MLDGSVRLDPTRARSVAELESIATGFTQSIGCRHFSYLVTRPPRGRVICNNIFIQATRLRGGRDTLRAPTSFMTPVVSTRQWPIAARRYWIDAARVKELSVFPLRQNVV